MKHPEIVERAQRLMVNDLAGGWTINRLASACNVSPGLLKEAFRQELGVPVYSWYRAQRMHMAARILDECPALPIAHVAATVGYANASKFSKAFKAHYGVNPSEWRRSASGAGTPDDPIRPTLPPMPSRQ